MQNINAESTSHSLLKDLWTLTLSPLLSSSYLPSLKWAQDHSYPDSDKEKVSMRKKRSRQFKAKKSKVERTEFGRSLTWCWHLAHPVDERRATGDPGWRGRPGVGLNVGSDPQLCLDCEGKMPLTQSAQIWPRELHKRKINEYFYELSSRYQLLNNVLGSSTEVGTSSLRVTKHNLA